MNKIDQIAQLFIEGEWHYNDENHTLIKAFATTQELSQLSLINKEGYLEPALKDAIIRGLGQQVLKNTQGPFGDTDIFSGDLLDGTTLYNIELHHISQDNLEALSKLANVVIIEE